MLTKPQLDAIDYVRGQAKTRRPKAIESIDHILAMSNISRGRFDKIMGSVMKNARVAFHFHPDRLDANMRTVAEALLDAGLYKSQFETLLSSGWVSPERGGARDLWEKKIFGGAYQQDGCDLSERPKYGALDIMAHPDGPAPRFGSCYFLLKPEVTQRCTFTYLDSHLDPVEKGTFDEFDDITAAVLDDSFSREWVLGEAFRPPELVEHCVMVSREPLASRFSRSHKRIFDHYIEAQIHGDVSLADDVEFLIADPAFKETAVEQHLSEICTKFCITLHWHGGYILPVSEVPDNFRGSTMPPLAAKVAPDGILNAKKIGEAAAALKRNPEAWGDEKPMLQELKLLWHVLLRFGQPADKA